MAYQRTSQSIRAYNIFKAVVTLGLVLIILILLLRGCRGNTPTPVTSTPTTTVPTPTPKVEQPTVAAPTPKVEQPAIVAPTLNISQISMDGTTTLSGTGTPGSNVEIWVDGERVGQTTVGADGQWSLSVPLRPGEHKLTARAVDASGKMLAESEALTVNVPEPVKVMLTSPQVNSDGTVALSGTGTPGSNVEIWVDGERVGQTTVGADGQWSLSVPLRPGEHKLTARAVDASGKMLAESEALTVNVPEPVKVMLTSPQVNSDGTVALSGTGTPGSNVEIWVDGERVGQTTVGADGQWSLSVPLRPGEHKLTARAVDASGKMLAESESFEFTVPASVKAPTLTAPLPNASITGDTVTLEGTGEPGAEIEILDNGNVVGKTTVQADGTWRFDYKCEPGAHSLMARNAGDEASTSDTVKIEVAAASKPAPEPATGRCSVDNIPMGIDQGTTYIVARCEYMSLIAKRVGVKLADLIAANPQVKNPDLIYPNQVLNLPPRR
ncbi:MAG TPA: Ig-like domain-containing protein [Anaerolineae bacterium]|nr:Ig-like domain-containing protein [Anaerolineae bacterium]